MNPELEEPKKEKTEQPEDKAKALLSELEKHGFTTPEEVANAVKASKETGNMARLLGDSRANERRMEQEIALLRQSFEKGMKPPQDSDSVDLSTLIKSAVRDVYRQDILEPQMKMQQQFHAEMQEVTEDEDYNLVKDAFQQHLYSPSVQYKLSRGETSVSKEYNKVIRVAMRTMLGRAAGTLKDVVAKPAPPHMEAGAETHIDLDPSSKEKLKNIHAARQKGQMSSDDALQAIVNQSLFGNPDGPKR